MTPIKAVVNIICAEWGMNRYHVAVFYNPLKGRQVTVKMKMGDENNHIYLLHELFGDFESTLTIKSVITDGAGERRRKFSIIVAGALQEGNKEDMKVLREFYLGAEKELADGDCE